MNVTVYLPGLATIARRSPVIPCPRESVNAFKTVLDRYPLGFLSVIPVIVGLRFLMSANIVSFPWTFRIAAIFAFTEAVPAIVTPAAIVSRAADGLVKHISDRTHRWFGIILGTVMIAWIRQEKPWH